jgi:hypothetical protein
MRPRFAYLAPFQRQAKAVAWDWGALTYDKSLGGFRTNVTEQQLKDAPEFSDDSWQDRDWETRTHRYYGAPQYWETGGRM